MRHHLCRIFTLFILLLSSAAFSETSPLKADSILVEKSKRTLSLLYKGEVVKTYKVALGPNPIGHKEKEGDGKTPEGKYKIDYRNPNSHYHKSLHISYPNTQDIQNAKKLGISPGGDIMIHGLGPIFAHLGTKQSKYNWTLGCIAVTDEEIDEIWAAVSDGVSVEIKP